MAEVGSHGSRPQLRSHRVLWAWTCPSPPEMLDTCLAPCVIGSYPLGREGPHVVTVSGFFFWEGKPYMSGRQIKKIYRIILIHSTARCVGSCFSMASNT